MMNKKLFIEQNIDVYTKDGHQYKNFWFDIVNQKILENKPETGLFVSCMHSINKTYVFNYDQNSMELTGFIYDLKKMKFTPVAKLVWSSKKREPEIILFGDYCKIIDENDRGKNYHKVVVNPCCKEYYSNLEIFGFKDSEENTEVEYHDIIGDVYDIDGKTFKMSQNDINQHYYKIFRIEQHVLSYEYYYKSDHYDTLCHIELNDENGKYVPLSSYLGHPKVPSDSTKNYSEEEFSKLYGKVSSIVTEENESVTTDEITKNILIEKIIKNPSKTTGWRRRNNLYWWLEITEKGYSILRYFAYGQRGERHEVYEYARHVYKDLKEVDIFFRTNKNTWFDLRGQDKSAFTRGGYGEFGITSQSSNWLNPEEFKVILKRKGLWIKEDSNWNNTAIEESIKEVYTSAVSRTYMDLLKNINCTKGNILQAELLCKAGFHNAYVCIILNGQYLSSWITGKTNLKDALRVSPKGLQRIREFLVENDLMNNWCSLLDEILKNTRRVYLSGDSVLTEDQIKVYLKGFKVCRDNGVTSDSLMRCYGLIPSVNPGQAFLKMSNYLAELKDQKETKWSVVQKYIDYLQMRRDLISYEIEVNETEFPVYPKGGMRNRISETGEVEEYEFTDYESVKSRHDNLVSMRNTRQQQIDEVRYRKDNERFQRVRKEWEHYEDIDNDSPFVFLIPTQIYGDAPTTVQFEGDNQHHCLFRSYGTRIRSGEYRAVFMRHKETPEVPFVTIGINLINGEWVVEQSYGKHDSTISNLAAKYLVLWAERKKIPLRTYNTYIHISGFPYSEISDIKSLKVTEDKDL